MDLQVVFLGTIRHGDALDIQWKLVEKRQNNRVGDTLLLLEHPPTMTLGKRENPDHLLVSKEELSRMGMEVVKTDRGGYVTYHGPGQLVGYPVIHLDAHGGSVRKYVHQLEEVFIRLLNIRYGIPAGRDDEHRGTWVGNGKITAIGCAVRRRVTMHGFAFNVNTNLEPYRWIQPCGITGKGVTSLAALTGRAHDMELVAGQVMESFCRVFQMTPRVTDAPYPVAGVAHGKAKQA